jgi:hypothetical protein
MSRFLDPQPDLITKKFREFLGEFKYHLGYLSNRHMIRYGVYHMFVSTFVTLCIILTFFPSGFSIFGVSSIFRNAFVHICSDASL